MSVKSIVRILIIGCIFILAIAFYGIFKFGSPLAVYYKVRGDELLFEHFSQNIGELEFGMEGRAIFQVTNLRSSKINILGARVSCGCGGIEGLPVALAPGAQSEIVVKVLAGEKLKRKVLADDGNDFTVSALIFTDKNENSAVISVSGKLAGVDSNETISE